VWGGISSFNSIITHHPSRLALADRLVRLYPQPRPRPHRTFMLSQVLGKETGVCQRWGHVLLNQTHIVPFHERRRSVSNSVRAIVCVCVGGGGSRQHIAIFTQIYILDPGLDVCTPALTRTHTHTRARVRSVPQATCGSWRASSTTLQPTQQRSTN
jgi:hypothetical protein